MINFDKYKVTYLCHTPCLVAKYSVMDAPVYLNDRQQVTFLGEEEISKDKWFTVFKSTNAQILYCIPRESFHRCFELVDIEDVIMESVVEESVEVENVDEGAG